MRIQDIIPPEAVVDGLLAETKEIEATIQEREVEQLSGMALGYATDGDLELAHKIAGKIAGTPSRRP